MPDAPLNAYETAIVRNADWFISRQSREGYIDADGDEFYGIRGDATLVGHAVTVRCYAHLLSGANKYLDSASRSLAWLAARQDKAGGWRGHSAFTLDGAQCVFEGFNTYQTISGDRQYRARADQGGRPHDRRHAEERRQFTPRQCDRDRRIRAFRAARLEDHRRTTLPDRGQADAGAYRRKLRPGGRLLAAVRCVQAAPRSLGAAGAGAAAARHVPSAAARAAGGARRRPPAAARGRRQPSAIRHEPDGRGGAARYARRRLRFPAPERADARGHRLGRAPLPRAVRRQPGRVDPDRYIARASIRSPSSTTRAWPRSGRAPAC